MTVETFAPKPKTRQVTPRIETLSPAFQQSPSANGTLTPVLVLKGMIADDGASSTCTVKTFSKTDHENRQILVTLDVVSESKSSLAPRAPSERPLLLTVRADPRGATFSSGPYQVKVQSPEGLALAQGELSFDEVA